MPETPSPDENGPRADTPVDPALGPADEDVAADTAAQAAPAAQERPPTRWFNWYGRARYFIVHNILHADDSPHRLALGVALGMWVALLPLVGIQMVVSATLCHPFKANKVVSMAMAWVSNPFTLVPIFLPCYWLGCWILGLDAIPYEDFVAIFFPPEGGGWVARVSATWQAMLGIFGPLWLGCLIVATIVAVPTYFVAERLITWYRMRRYGTVDMSALEHPMEPRREP